MDASQITFHITGGPSRGRLFDHVKYLYEDEEGAPTVSIHFSTWARPDGTGAKIVGVRIHSIRHKDNTGYNFTLEGTCLVETFSKTEDVFSQHKFLAFYNSKKRKGKIELLP